MDNLLGIAAREWFRLLRENHFAVDPGYRNRLVRITTVSLWNSVGKWREQRRYGPKVAGVSVKAPLFILGHWRSGTTLLHELLAFDEQFAYPNLFQVSNPHTFLIREWAVERALGEAVSRRRPMDNVQVTFRSPGEDEWALAVTTLQSPLIGWTFPRRADFYDRYLTFRGVSQQEVEIWRNAFLTLLRKLTWRYEGRPLLLKSPPHTGRIRLLLETFPDARFVHISRDPYAVFLSTRRLYQTAAAAANLQRDDPNRLDDGILQRYVAMYQAFFEECVLIPAGQYCELRFEDLENDMVGQIGRVYEHLGLPGFAELRPKLAERAGSITGYQKNRYPEIDEPTRRRIASSWQRNFEEWEYPVMS